jgi:hypothetical protein
MKESYFVFRYNGKELCAYAAKDTFLGECDNTIELLAAENNIPKEDIDISLEFRSLHKPHQHKNKRK